MSVIDNVCYATDRPHGLAFDQRVKCGNGLCDNMVCRSHASYCESNWEHFQPFCGSCVRLIYPAADSNGQQELGTGVFACMICLEERFGEYHYQIRNDKKVKIRVKGPNTWSSYEKTHSKHQGKVYCE